MSLIAKIKALVTAHRNRNIGVYMDRWYIVPPEWHLPFSVRLHHIKMADTRIHHNHPYAFKSMVLKGWYIEEQVVTVPDCNCQLPATREVMHLPLRWHNIARLRYHRIINMSKGGVWTIIVHPRKPKEYAWGYLDEQGRHIPQEQYKRPIEFASQKNIDLGNVVQLHQTK